MIMLPFTSLSLILALFCCTHGVHGACEDILAPAILKGKRFFSSRTGDYIPIKGVNYYPRPNDGDLVLTNSVDFFTEEFRYVWERDVANFVKLKVNAVRIYAVNPGLNHDAFMCALKSAGIYAIIGLGADCEHCSIASEPAPECYHAELKTRGEFIIHEFSRYDNVLAFSAGNEVNIVVPFDQPEVNGPCLKKFVRDMRAYMKGCPSMRQIPVGVESADTKRRLNSQYYNCRSDPDDELENAEYYGINVYLHCDGSAQTIEDLTGFNDLRSMFANFALTIPVLLTEFGCTNPSFPTIDGYEGQRDFLQVDALFSSSYSTTFAGGFVFEYSTEKVFAQDSSPYPFTSSGPGNFGVGYMSPEFCDEVETPCTYTPFPQFDTLAGKYEAVDSSLLPNFADYVPEVTTLPECPAQFPPLSSFVWQAFDEYKCPDDLIVYCPGIPLECLSTFPPVETPTGSSSSTPAPTTASNPTSGSKPVSAPTTPKSPSITPTAPNGQPTKLPLMALFPTSSTRRLGGALWIPVVVVGMISFCLAL
jgi:1,3-beta-glucanosyltransferase GAS5